jgi:hypothetical protein
MIAPFWLQFPTQNGITLAELWPYLKNIATVGVAAWAVWTYRNAQRQRRAEWLEGLYIRFYEQPQYKKIRRLLDYEPEPELTNLRRAIQSGGESDSCEELVDYLNFFEFLGSLEAMKQVSAKEIEMLFEYYIRRLNEHPFVTRFIDEQGFEHLSSALSKRRKVVTPAS